jgi:hypothetical protein
MNTQQQIEKLQNDLKQLQSNQANCNHDWKDAIYDPETVKEGYGSVQDGAGSDPHWSYAGYRDVQKDRWSRECKLCGKKEYTYTQAPVVTSYKPKFN